MAATSFPLFLELPRELQIQVREEAIEETVVLVPFDKSRRRAHIAYITYTIEVLAKNCMHREWDSNYYEGAADVVLERMTRPCFASIMNTSHFSRLVACKWWRRIMEPCVPGPGHGWDDVDVRMKGKVLKQLGDMIEDLQIKLAGGPAVPTRQ